MSLPGEDRGGRTLHLAPLKAGELEASATLRDGSLQIQLRGQADSRLVATLSGWLRELHREATRLEIARALVDLRRLELMDPACFKALVSWIGEVQECPEERQYPIRFLSDPKLLWQVRSLRSLSCFAADLVTIEAC